MHSRNPSSLSKADQLILLELSRASIRHGVATGRAIPVNLAALPPELVMERATFVTLQKYGELRGCIGCLEAHRPLAEDIAANAFAAAFRDSRFAPVTAEEIDALEIHLSLLTPAVPLAFNSEAELLSQLAPGQDGLILEDGPHRGTFLPTVWASLPDPPDFLRHLKLKAGLPGNYWSTTLKVHRYQTELIQEP